jgi:glycerate kinase
LHALLGAVLRPRFDMVMHYTNFDVLLAEADLVLTGEGTLDSQTPFGKVPAEVARRAKARSLPVIALAGAIGEGAKANLDCGIDAFASIQMRPQTLGEALASAPDLLRHATEDTMRMVAVGMRLRDAVGRDPRATAARGRTTTSPTIRMCWPSWRWQPTASSAWLPNTLAGGCLR